VRIEKPARASLTNADIAQLYITIKRLGKDLRADPREFKPLHWGVQAAANAPDQHFG